MGIKKRSTTINEYARRVLDISRDDYALCQYVQYRSSDPRSKHPGWCDDPKDSIADFVGISRQGLYKMVNRLCQIGLLEEDKACYRVTAKWIDAENESKQSLQKEDVDCKQSLHTTVNKVYTDCKQSLHPIVNKVDTTHIKYDISENKLENRESDFFAGPSIQVLEVSVFEPPRIDIIPVEENPQKEKKLKGRGPRKTAEPEQYEDRDIAKHLEKKEQVFFAEILNQGIWREYLNHRAGHKSKPGPYKSAKTCALQVQHFYRLSDGNIDLAAQVLEQCKRREWLDLYPLQTQNNNGRQNGNGIANGIAAQDFRKEFFFGGVDFPTK